MPSKVRARRRRRFTATIVGFLAVILSVGARGAQSDAVIDSRFFTTSDHVRLHYLEAGRGATLVFVPGWMMPAQIWMPQIRYFAQMWREILHGVDKPTLYVVTAHFKEQASNLKRSRPKVQVAVFEDAGHALFVDEPERFNRLLEAFIGKISHRRVPATSAR